VVRLPRFAYPPRGVGRSHSYSFSLGSRTRRLSRLSPYSNSSVVSCLAYVGREGFELGSELDVESKISETEAQLEEARSRRSALHESREVDLHPTDDLREELRVLGARVSELASALRDNREALEELVATRSELITAKTKAVRIVDAGTVLDKVQFVRCPSCGNDLDEAREGEEEACRLCGRAEPADTGRSTQELEAMRRDLNQRIDELGDSIARREAVVAQTEREVQRLRTRKRELDEELEREVARYDSAFVESVRSADRQIATLEERLSSYARLQEMPRAVSELEEAAGSLQGRIDRLRADVKAEKARLGRADEYVAAIAEEFHAVMLRVGFPGVSTDDEVLLDARNWRPRVAHGHQEWDFWDAGSGGKKTLYNVCYAIALHRVGLEKGLPIPSLLIVDSPTKNISEDENPAIVHSLYNEIYSLAGAYPAEIQFLLIDSDLVRPEGALNGFTERRMAGTTDSPSLISYYSGP